MRWVSTISVIFGIVGLGFGWLSANDQLPGPIAALIQSDSRLISGTVIEDTQANRIAAAKRLLVVADYDAMFRNAIIETGNSLPAEERTAYFTFVTQRIDFDRLRQIAINGAILTFTAAELNSLADYYASDNGKSVMKNMPTYYGLVMPELLSEIQNAAEAF